MKKLPVIISLIVGLAAVVFAAESTSTEKPAECPMAKAQCPMASKSECPMAAAAKKECSKEKSSCCEGKKECTEKSESSAETKKD